MKGKSKDGRFVEPLKILADGDLPVSKTRSDETSYFRASGLRDEALARKHTITAGLCQEFVADESIER